MLAIESNKSKIKYVLYKEQNAKRNLNQQKVHNFTNEIKYYTLLNANLKKNLD